MKKVILLLALTIMGLSDLTAQNFYLHSNGVTCMCPDAAIGETGVVNGVMYTKRTKEQITDANATTTCTSGITDMSNLFYPNTGFNGDISSWDVSDVTNMINLFLADNLFNQDIGFWDVSNVTNMTYMFASASSFNQDISNWDVNNVTNMRAMFNGAFAFNQPIGNWDVSNVINMTYMFDSADTFNQDLGNWDVSNVTTMGYMFGESLNSNLSTENYDAILNGWATLSLQPSVIFDAVGVNYCDGEQARQNIIDNFGWDINDAGLDCSLGIDFITSTSIFIYPNPATRIININSKTIILKTEIYNLFGQLISKNYTHTFGVENLATGMYYLQIETNKGTFNRNLIKE